MGKDLGNCVTLKQLNKEKRIIMKVDKHLVAERVAIEVKAHLEVYGYFHPVFKSYLMSAGDDLIYSEKQESEILGLAKMILKDKYKIEIISESPLECVKMK